MKWLRLIDRFANWDMVFQVAVILGMIALGIYFSGAIIYAIQSENYATVPFLLLFVWGYLYTGLMSLFQGSFQRWRRSADSAQEVGVPDVALPALPATPAPAAAAAASAPTAPGA